MQLGTLILGELKGNEMRKDILAIALVISTVGTAETFSAEVTNRWTAKDPYAGTVYEKENVSKLNKVINYSVSIGSEIWMLSKAADFVYSNAEFIPYQSNVPLLSNIVSLSYPTLSTVGYLSLGAAGLVLSLPANMGITYVAKKGTSVVGTVMTYGWDVFKYGFNTVNYQFNHLRAQYLQGTIWSNNHVVYAKKEEKTS